MKFRSFIGRTVACFLLEFLSSNHVHSNTQDCKHRLKPVEQSLVRGWKEVLDDAHLAAFPYSQDWYQGLKRDLARNYSALFYADVAVSNDEAAGFDVTESIVLVARKRASKLLLTGNTEVLRAAAVLDSRGIITVVDFNPGHLNALKFVLNESLHYSDLASWKRGVLKLARAFKQLQTYPIAHRSFLSDVLEEIDETGFCHLRAVVRTKRITFISADWKSANLIAVMKKAGAPLQYDLIYVSNIPQYVKQRHGPYASSVSQLNSSRHFRDHLERLSDQTTVILGGMRFWQIMKADRESLSRLFAKPLE